MLHRSRLAATVQFAALLTGLVVSDASAQSIQLVHELIRGPTGGGAASLTNLGSELAYVGRSTSVGYEAWRSDGRSLRLILDALSGSYHGNPRGMSYGVDTLFYQTQYGVFPNGIDAVVVAVGPAGTKVVRMPSGYRLADIGARGGFALANGTGYVFRGYEPNNASGVTLFTDGVSVRTLAKLWPRWMERSGRYVYFTDELGSLHRSDGKTTTELFTFVGRKVINSKIFGLASYGNRLVWIQQVQPNVSPYPISYELMLDGNRLATIAGRARTESYPWVNYQKPAVVGSNVFVVVEEKSGLRALWRYRPDAAPAVLHRAASIQALCPLGEQQLVFMGDAAEPWITDGSAAGTRLLKDVHPGPAGSVPQPISLYGDVGVSSRYALFYANDGSHGHELWITDGTAAGTRMLPELEAGAGSALMGREALVVGGFVYLATGNKLTGVELYRLAIGATAQPAPAGCGRVGDPQLAATDPVLGTSMEFQGTGATGSFGFLALGLLSRPGREYLPSCRIPMDPTAWFPLYLNVSKGEFRLRVRLPSDARLLGQSFAAIASFLDSSVPELVRLSNAVVLHPGN